MIEDVVISIYLGAVLCFSSIPTLPTYRYIVEGIVQDAPEGVE